MVVEGISGAAPPALDGDNIAYWGPWMGNTTWTISWRLTNISKSNDTYSLYMGLQSSIDKSIAGYFYIDNVRVLTEDVPDPPLRLHVEDNKLINSDGNEVTLRGVSLIDVGFLQDWQGGASNMVNRLTDQTDLSCDSVGWKTNVIRIPVVPPADVSGWPHPFDPNNTDLYDLIRSVVDYCAMKNAYAIIDWHAIDDMTSARIAEANEFWTYMAPLFADDTHVMFELYNEPIDNDGNDAENWAVVKAGMETLIDTVRAYAPNTVLLVGTPQYCQIIGPMVDDPNVVYVSHIYPWHWINETLYHTTNLAAAAHPVVLGEWGFISDGSGGTLDGTITNYGDPLREFVEGLGIGNIAWVSSPDWQPPMYDYNDYNDNSIWTLTEGDGYMGCFVKDWLYDGWISTQNTNIALTISRCVVTAGASRGQDSFEASGTIASVPPNLLGVETIDVNIVSGVDGNDIYTEDVNFSWDYNGNRFIWSTAGTGRITQLILNFRAKTFVIKAQNINLAGLGAPVHLDFTLGDYMLSGDANEAIVNGTSPIPAQLMSGYENTLNVNLASVSDSASSLRDTLYCIGNITAQDIAGSNLTNQAVVITWANQGETVVQNFTLPAGRFRRTAANCYECTNALTSEGARVNAKINLGACTFTVLVRNTNLSVTSGVVKLGISFTGFDETDEIDNLQVTRPSILRYLRR
ncbi:MAG: cellulase family glycosylhydrolase [Planctomycetota bacterium]